MLTCPLQHRCERSFSNILARVPTLLYWGIRVLWKFDGPMRKVGAPQDISGHLVIDSSDTIGIRMKDLLDDLITVGDPSQSTSQFVLLVGSYCCYACVGMLSEALNSVFSPIHYTTSSKIQSKATAGTFSAKTVCSCCFGTKTRTGSSRVSQGSTKHAVFRIKLLSPVLLCFWGPIIFGRRCPPFGLQCIFCERNRWRGSINSEDERAIRQRIIMVYIYASVPCHDVDAADAFNRDTDAIGLQILMSAQRCENYGFFFFGSWSAKLSSTDTLKHCTAQLFIW